MTLSPVYKDRSWLVSVLSLTHPLTHPLFTHPNILPPTVTWAKILQESIDKYPKDQTASLASVASLNPLKLQNRCIIPRKVYYPTGHPTEPVLISTTDVRASKAAQLIDVSSAASLAWWFPTPNTQFRLNGSARIVRAGDKNEEWEKVRVDLWKAMSPFMRGTFGRGGPDEGPGARMEKYEEGEDWPVKLGAEPDEGKDEAETKLIAMAKDNFALIVIEPSMVDYTELGLIPNQRTVYTLESEEWKTEIQCP